MFDIGMGELALIGVLALFVLGPKRLPEVARMAGLWVGRMRRFIASVKEDFDQELQTEELADLRNLQDEISETRQLIQRSSSEALDRLQREVDAPPQGKPAEKPRRRNPPSRARTSKRKKTVARAKPSKKTTARKKDGGARKPRRR